MSVELPVIQPRLKIGQINLAEHSVEINTKYPINFNCIGLIDCCSNMDIPASKLDIDRIMEHGYELDQIIREASPIILNPKSSLGHQKKAYILKKKPFDNTCTFLEGNKCKIHEFKPFACMIYPFSIDFIDDVRIKILIHPDQLCEAIKSASIDRSNNKEILENIRTRIEEELTIRGYPSI